MINYIVYGLGISGLATAKYLHNNHLNIIATDDNLARRNEFAKLYPQITVQNPENIIYNSQTVISFSPGIPLFFPQPHDILKKCAESGAKLACDMEIFYDLNRNLDNIFIGITGTNGKSTTTALIGNIFEKLGIPSSIGGNIGVPCFNLPQNQNNFSYIFETSSYQIDLLTSFKFDIACLLNITPDHIDRYGTFENYIASKERIFVNQDENDYAIIGIDNSNSYQIFKKLNEHQNFKSRIVKISARQIVDYGVSVIDQKVFIKLADQELTLPINPQIKGQHNHENIACAIAVTCCYLIKKSQFNLDIACKVIDIIEQFSGLKHRLQLVKKIDNISFINDSKATNAESTENALKAYKNILWIVGGRPKEGGINILKPLFSSVKKAYLIGEATEDFAKTLDEEKVNYVKSQDLIGAFKQAYADAKTLDNSQEVNIILSPACASLDQWKNFEERGDFFCKLVNEI